MRADTIICVFRSKHHERTIRIGRFSVHARGLIGREVNPIFPANAWRKFRWNSTQDRNRYCLSWPTASRRADRISDSLAGRSKTTVTLAPPAVRNVRRVGSAGTSAMASPERA